MITQTKTIQCLKKVNETDKAVMKNNVRDQVEQERKNKSIHAFAVCKVN